MPKRKKLEDEIMRLLDEADESAEIGEVPEGFRVVLMGPP
jgi:hypothetical protein